MSVISFLQDLYVGSMFSERNFSERLQGSYSLHWIWSSETLLWQIPWEQAPMWAQSNSKEPWWHWRSCCAFNSTQHGNARTEQIVACRTEWAGGVWDSSCSSARSQATLLRKLVFPARKASTSISLQLLASDIFPSFGCFPKAHKPGFKSLQRHQWLISVSISQLSCMAFCWDLRQTFIQFIVKLHNRWFSYWRGRRM